MSMSQQSIDLSASLSNPPFMAGITAVPQPFTHSRSPACPDTGPSSFLPFFFFVSLWFIFAVPSFLPFQKVMHTRKRHSELYHELNHSSKFHTIDRYSRDPAMSTFKVRPLPSRAGWEPALPMHLHPLSHFVTTLKPHPYNTEELTPESKTLTLAQIKIAPSGMTFICKCS